MNTWAGVSFSPSTPRDMCGLLWLYHSMNRSTGSLLRISMWELVSFHAVFTMCVIAYAKEASVRHKAIKNSDTYPFEALPQYHSSSICQNYFAVSTTRLSLNA